MTEKPNYYVAKELSEAVKRDTEKFEAFLIGYVNGAQDYQSNRVPESKDGFETRVNEVFKQEYPESLL